MTSSPVHDRQEQLVQPARTPENSNYSLTAHQRSYDRFSSWYLEKMMHSCCSFWEKDAVDGDYEHDYTLELEASAAAKNNQLNLEQMRQQHCLLLNSRPAEEKQEIAATGSVCRDGILTVSTRNSSFSSEQQAEEPPTEVLVETANIKPDKNATVDKPVAPESATEKVVATPAVPVKRSPPQDATPPRRKELLSFWDEKVRPLSVRTRSRRAVFKSKPAVASKASPSRPASIPEVETSEPVSEDTVTPAVLVPSASTELVVHSSSKSESPTGVLIIKPELTVLKDKEEEQVAELFAVLRKLSMEYNSGFGNGLSAGVNDYTILINSSDENDTILCHGINEEPTSARSAPPASVNVFSKECLLFQKWVHRASFSSSFHALTNSKHIDVDESPEHARDTNICSENTDLQVRQQERRSMAMAA